MQALLLALVTDCSDDDGGDSGESDSFEDLHAAISCTIPFVGCTAGDEDGGGGGATVTGDASGFGTSVEPDNDPKELAFAGASDDAVGAFRRDVNAIGVSGFLQELL